MIFDGKSQTTERNCEVHSQWSLSNGWSSPRSSPPRRLGVASFWTQHFGSRGSRRSPGPGDDGGLVKDVAK